MILEEIAEKTRRRVELAKEKKVPEQMEKEALAMECDTGFPFEKKLRLPGISFICEVKKASPSKGVIAEDFAPLSIAREYEKSGADAISVLTEPDYFLGDIRYLRGIRGEVEIPLLRKDFTVDPYMIYEAKAAGASAVLLICTLLDDDMLRRCLGVCDRLGLSALVEAHDGEEIGRALAAGARVIGVNNRNLKDFTVDIQNAIRLRQQVPPEILFVAESGIRSREDVRKLEENGVDAVLIGETLMRSPDKKAALAMLRGMGREERRI